ncbi:hypothetical protein BZG35_08560 [Brevundimonas sp. LM2]|uniref:putative entry exclusion protein TrbK-alt n=1 Tax=Brevundimonas sp. LM2 TaxID=1938605 RepID=UPI000983E690|nr:putative entry exclusion protein TrbK-alt [Brevundimonas sp. LM2]AQR61698.1 hypothetical protein BZG35_08560 [Brevundimonas sp. LM2]
MTALRALSAKGWAALAGGLLITGLVLAALAAAVQTPPAGPAASDRPRATVSAELDRCRALGVDGGADPVCQAAWKARRDAFFGKGDGS